MWGDYGSNPGFFKVPTGITTDILGNVYVADRDNHRVQKFDSDGNYLTKWDNNGYFYTPNKVAVSQTGLLYIVSGDYNIVMINMGSLV